VVDEFADVPEAETERGETRGFSPSVEQFEKLLLRRSNNVLGRLGHTELDNRLGLDLDGLAGLGVAAHASLALCLHQAADSRNNEDAVLLGLLDGRLSQQVKKRSGLLVGEFELLGQVPCERSLCKSSCHVMFSFRACPRGSR
jgi:hypothetical protein